MNNDEYYKYEDRAYINPTLSSGEQEEFINNFRDVQNQNNAQINEQTTNLGTDVPSNLGGLGGGSSYFSSRYQTPQVGEMVANLKSVAQAQVLNDVMQNYSDQLQNKYKQAYRKYQSRERARARSSGGGNSLSDLLKALGLGGKPANPDVDTTDTSVKGVIDKNHVEAQLRSGETTMKDGPYTYTRDAKGNVTNTNDPTYKKRSDGYFRTDRQEAERNKSAQVSASGSSLAKLVALTAGLSKLSRGF